MSHCEPHWYALRVRSRHEKRVVAALEGEDVEVFLPIYRTRRQWSDRVKAVELPLFPGYLFVRSCLDPESKLAILRASRSIVEIVGTRRRPAPIPSVEIESIRTLINSTAEIFPVDQFEEGRRVRVVGGPFHDVEGIVLRRGAHRTIVCTVPLLGRAVKTHLSEGNLIPVSAPPSG